jgi:hypothetical protein
MRHRAEQGSRLHVSHKAPTLPNFLVIGAAKSGTTSLHGYLSQHPQIFMPSFKSLAYFDPRLRWNLGTDWYKSHFTECRIANGEASPQYTMAPMVPGVPQRIKSVLGTPKMIYIIRDPVDRILSDYTEIMEQWPSDRTFRADEIETTWKQSLLTSRYFFQLSEYLKVFPRETILVVLLERLNGNPHRVLREIFRFLEVDEEFWSHQFDMQMNSGDRKRHFAKWFTIVAPAFLQAQVLKPTWMPWKIRQVLNWISRKGGRRILKPSITPEDDSHLQKLLKSDVDALKSLLNDELPEWRPYA